jgi:hypothetical protein
MPVVGASRAIFDPAMESTVTLGNLVPGMRDLWLAIWLGAFGGCVRWLGEIFKSQKYSFWLRSNQILDGFPLKLSVFPIFKTQKYFFRLRSNQILDPSLGWLSIVPA